MKRLYIMPLLAILSACASGSIFGNNPSDSVEPQQENVINQTNEKQEIRPDYAPYYLGRKQGTTTRQIYTVLASRATNKMLKSTEALYAGAKYPSLYVGNPVSEGTAAVEQPEYLTAIVKDIVTGSHSYVLSDKKTQANYVLESFISNNSVAAANTKVIVYKIILKDNQQKEIGTWVETLSPIMNDDQSWW